MPTHLGDIRVLDLRLSILDDGDVTPLRTAYGEAVVKYRTILKTDPKAAEKFKEMVEEKKEELQKAEEGLRGLLNECRKTGVFKFKVKRYIDYSGNVTFPEYAFEWVRYSRTNDYREFQTYQANHWTKVTPDGDYWPEGIAPDPEGEFRFGDAILLKQDLRRHLVKKQEDKLLADRAGKGEMDKFRSRVEREGGVVPDEDIERLTKMVRMT